jgi:hypothetical protein
VEMCGVEGHSSPRFKHSGRMTACFGSAKRDWNTTGSRDPRSFLTLLFLFCNLLSAVWIIHYILIDVSCTGDSTLASSIHNSPQVQEPPRFKMRWTTILLAAAAAVGTEASSLHPPVLPLFVRNPYLSTWLGWARGNPWDRWPIFWTGQEVRRLKSRWQKGGLTRSLDWILRSCSGAKVRHSLPARRQASRLPSQERGKVCLLVHIWDRG